MRGALGRLLRLPSAERRGAHASRRAEKALVAVYKVTTRRARAERAAQSKVLKRNRHQARMERRRAATLPDAQVMVAELLRRPEGLALDDYEYRVTSQHGEDGLTVEILRRAGIEHHRGVEIGCGANGGNAGVLVAGLGFEALLLDGDDELIVIARNYLAGQPARVEQAWIASDTVNDLLARHRFDRDLDYLGIDIDGVDYWIWEALDVCPRLLIAEYNSFFGPDASVTVPYAPDFVRGARDESGRFIYPKGYFGASLTALERLGRRKGYRLIGTAPGSVSAYFLRDDIDAGLPDVSATDAWRAPTKGRDAVPHHEERLEKIQSEGPRAYFEQQGWPLVEIE